MTTEESKQTPHAKASTRSGCDRNRGRTGNGPRMARCLARAGAHVVVASKRRSGSRQWWPNRSLGVQAQGSQPTYHDDDVKRMVQQTIDRFGKIDILVNNAGDWSCKPMIEQTEEEWDRVLNVNLKGVFLCCRQVVPEMIARKRGAIVNIASIAAFHVTVPHVPYAASKAGVVALTRDLAYEVGRMVSASMRSRPADRNADGPHSQRRATPARWRKHPAGPDGSTRRYRRSGRLSGFRRRELHHRSDVAGQRRHRPKGFRLSACRRRRP